MNIDFEKLFPDGLSGETASAISDVLNEIARRWEHYYFHPIRHYRTQRQADLFDSEQAWRRKSPDD